ncbi:MAG: 50S ribosomal protein L4 [Anaerolineales bacterium]|jgi:large subunit ribosomal protein L4|nr:50S ribosomal protein L4 [Anaerolineales bacterium]MBX3004195.1 50S ribosomal protein L4 [Anaerolineales bacterium]
MKLDVYTLKGTKLDQQAELPASVFEAPINVDLMHQAYTRQMANAHLGTRKTKTRAEVSGGGRKPWKQKGTGRARQGSIRSPQWVGGGKVHTPRPKSFEQDMPQKMRQAALRSALSSKAADQDIVLVENLALDEAKTKIVAEALTKLVGESTALLVLPSKDEDYVRVVRAGRNLQSCKTLLANYLNVRDLLGYDKLILPLDAIKAIESALG